jgi:hypothetical protein
MITALRIPAKSLGFGSGPALPGQEDPGLPGLLGYYPEGNVSFHQLVDDLNG